MNVGVILWTSSHLDSYTDCSLWRRVFKIIFHCIFISNNSLHNYLISMFYMSLPLQPYPTDITGQLNLSDPSVSTVVWEGARRTPTHPPSPTMPKRCSASEPLKWTRITTPGSVQSDGPSGLGARRGTPEHWPHPLPPQNKAHPRRATAHIHSLQPTPDVITVCTLSVKHVYDIYLYKMDQAWLEQMNEVLILI